MRAKNVAAGLIAGVLIFIWSSIAHIALPTGELGIKSLPNEAPVVAALKGNISEPGFYFYPGGDMKHMTSEQRAAWEKKLNAGPHGLVLYHPGGAEAMSPKQLTMELLSDLLIGMILAGTLWAAAVRVQSFFGRVQLVTLLGALPIIATDFSHWNWFGFPIEYLVAQVIDQVVAAFNAGVFLAWWFRNE